MKKIHVIIGSVVLLFVGIGVVLLVRGEAPSVAQSEGARKSAYFDEVTLMLDWTPNVNHVALFVALEGGHFAAEGLKVNIIEPGEVYPAAAVASGRVEFGIDYQEYLTLLDNEEHDLVSIAAMLQSNTSGFATRRADNIESIADFASLTYGTFNAPFEEPTLRALLACYGADAGAIEYVPAGNDLLAMLAEEQADVVWIFYGTQGFQAEELGIEIDYFPMRDESDCIPDYYTPIIISSNEYLAANPKSARAFLAALESAYQFVIDEPVEAAEMLAAAAPHLDTDELQRSIVWLADYMRDEEERWGAQRLAVWQEYAEWMYEQGLLAEAPTAARIDALFTNDYLPER